MSYEGGPPTIEEPGAPGELDALITRAVDRQIAEQRSLREHITALTNAVNALGQSAPRLDADDVADKVRAATRAAVDPIVTEIRILSENVATVAQRRRAEPEPIGAQAGAAPANNDIAEIRASVGAVSADIEGIAQALIDLNAGLRDWAKGVDRSIAGIRDTVERVRELASRAEVQRIGREDVAEGELVDDDAGAGRAITTLSGSEIEQRMKESVELSLYLADQIEEFDRVLRGMGDLPQKLEAVVAQGVRRTLTARAKLDTEATGALDDALASLDEYVDKMSGTADRFGDSEETLRRLGLGQVELASRMDSLYEAVGALAAGRAVRLKQPKPKPKPPKPKAATKKPTKRKPPKRRSKVTKAADDTAAD